MRLWVVMASVLISPGVWGYQGTVETRDGRTFSGHIRLESQRLILANADANLSVSIALTNLLNARFPGDNTPPPNTQATGQTLPASPESWLVGNIGDQPPLGDSRFAQGVYHLNTWATNIAGASDSFQFIYKTVEGESELVARILQVRYTGPWARAGIMMRQSLDPNAPNIFIGAHPVRGGILQHRPQAGADTEMLPVPGLLAPSWVRLKRVGNTFSAYSSRDGRQWRLAGRIELAMPGQIYVGLAVAGARSPERATELTKIFAQSFVPPPAASYRRAQPTPPPRPVFYKPTPLVAVFDHVAEGPFLSGSFVPRIVMENGSTASGRILSADDDNIMLVSPNGASTALQTDSVSHLLFQWSPSRFQQLISAGRPGVLLANGDFVDGMFRGIDQNRIRISSVLMGLKTYDLGGEVVGVVLRKPKAAQAAYEVQTQDGSTWYAQQLEIQNGDILIQQSTLHTRKVPIYEVRLIRRLPG